MNARAPGAAADAPGAVTDSTLAAALGAGLRGRSRPRGGAIGAAAGGPGPGRLPYEPPVDTGAHRDYGAPMPTAPATLILDFLDWLAAAPRSYAEAMEVWRTSCPRLTVWEDAVDEGLVVRRTSEGRGAVVALTPKGRAWLERDRRGAGADAGRLAEV